MKLSVIICTHNPHPDYLRRTLDGLKAQTLPLEQWELLLIDNASQEPVAGSWDLSWHPRARHVREEKLGVTPARLRGIEESRSELVVMVDDDNILRADFLAKVIEVSTEHPFLGAWGGNIEGEFEHEVPEWLKPHLHILAVRAVKRDHWSNYYADYRSMPVGAGLCIRRPIAVAHARALAARPSSMDLDRKGASLVSGGDIDFALTAHDCGFGTGVFPRLQMTHIIPKARMTVDYICRLREGIEYSTHLLRSQRNPRYTPPAENSKLKKWLRAYQVWRLPEPAKSLVKAEDRGLARAKAEIAAKSAAESI
jgi:glycosyltransferase involved in cell wall biosynthesis